VLQEEHRLRRILLQFLRATAYNYAIALYAIAIPSVRLSVTRVDQSKAFEVRIMQLSPYSSPIPLVSAG